MMVYSSYSFRNALGMPADIVPLLKEQGQTYAPIADIASTFGHHSWMRTCEEHGLKPVFGVSLYVTPAPAAKKPVLDLWQFYAIENVKSVYDLVTLSFQQGRSLPRLGFTPMLRYDQIEGLTDLIKITGHRARLELMTPHENLYVGVSPASSFGFLRRASDRGFATIASQINRFAKPEDELAWELACGFNASVQTYPQHILPFGEWKEKVTPKISNGMHGWVASLPRTFSKCTATLNKGSMIEPERPDTLRNLCIAGAAKLGVDLADAKYSERLDHELSVIEKKGFEDYFYLASDFLSWARKNMSVGPGRGSSAGSLVCYLLEITFVDPLKYDLLFSRFLDESRPDWPDVDSDVSDRDRAIEYLETKYGKERVAKIGTFAMWQAKNTTNEVTKALSIPRFEADAVLNVIPDFAAGDSRKDTALAVALETTSEGQRFIEKYPGFEHVKKIVGTPSHAATHASAVVLTQEALSNFVGVDPINGRTMCDMHEAEALGLLKLDVLGIDTLTIIEETLRLAGLPNNHMEGLSLDDQDAFDVLNDQRFFGIFQFDKTVAGLAKEMTVDRFSDISALLALGRPGPLSSGAASRWVKKRRGDLEVTYPHELLKPYLLETYGELIYQEQAMLIANEIAGMSWAATSKLRKAIGKSQGDAALAEHREPFVTGLEKAGLTNSEAEGFWRELMGFGSYGFNKSHAVAYGMVTYWTCWLKAHYSAEFAAATLSFKKNAEKQMEILRDLAKEGIGYTAVDPENSTDKWRVVNRGNRREVVGPLSLVKGIGPKMISQIMSARARNEPLPDRALKLLSNPKTDIDELYPVEEALKKIDLSSHGVRSEVTPCGDAKPNGSWWENVICVGVANVIAEHDENEDRRVSDRIERGQAGIMTGPTKFVEIRLADSTGVLYAKIGRKEYNDLQPKIEGAKVNKTLIMVRGTVCPEAPVMLVKNIKIIGEI